MKKRTFIVLSSLSLLLCMGGAQVANAIHPAAGINLLAEDDGEKTFSTNDGKSSVTMSKSEDGTTLTVKGKGDLTQFSTKYSFATSLPQNIYSGEGDNKTAVSANATYDSSTTYYTRSNVYTEIENFADTYVKNNTHYYFTEQGAAKYYTRTAQWDSETNSNKPVYTAVTKGSEVLTTEAWDQIESKQVLRYYTCSGTGDDKIYTRISSITDITSSKDDVTSEEKQELSGCKDIYVKSGSSYTQVSDNQEYDSSKTYYKLSYNYSSVDFDFLNNSNFLVGTNDFITALMTYAACDSIIFENEDDSNPLYIDNNIVKAMLYPKKESENYSWYEVNSKLQKLDLGAATCKNLSQTTFTNSFSANGQSKLSDITLPLADTGGDSTMVVPAQIVTTFQGTCTTITIPEGYTKIGDYAFGANNNNAYSYIAMDNATCINLPSTIKEIGDYAFTGCSKLKSITMNEGLTYIGKYAFWSSGLESITFPSTLDKIDDAAFADLKIEISFNEGLRYIGAGAFALGSNMVCQTIEIPTTVRYIGPGAFNFRQYQDVYFLGKDAPLMPMGSYSVGQYTTQNAVAFSEYTLMGNNGFQSANSGKDGDLAENTSTGYANRENYKGNSAYFCILHYPQGLTDEQANKYKDQTRVYLTETTNFNANNSYTAGKEEDNKQWTIYGSMSQPQKEVNYGYQDTYLGDQYVWPSQTQWGRAYVVASNGYNWDGTTAYYANLSDDDYKILKEAGIIEGEIAKLTDEEKQNLQKIAHLGTRMFVLANADSKTTPDYPVNIKSANKWWTIVVPFNMTKSQVDEVFGDGQNATHVCRFNKADRRDNGYGDKLVKLYFTDDVYAHKAVKDENGDYGKSETTAPGNDDIVIYAHEAYMIYPTKYIDYDKGERYTVKDYTLVTGSPVPTLIKANTHDTSYTGEDNTEYRFIGNYIGEVSSSKIETEGEAQTASAEKAYVPQYSYMYAKKKNESNYKFWFWYGTTANGVVFTPNTCVVQATDKDGGSKDYTDIFDGSKTGASVSAKQISIFGDEEDETTGIENIEIVTPDTNANGIVYNLSGQPVSNGSTNGLAKGIYIKNGKKFVVK